MEFRHRPGKYLPAAKSATPTTVIVNPLVLIRLASNDFSLRTL